MGLVNHVTYAALRILERVCKFSISTSTSLMFICQEKIIIEKGFFILVLIILSSNADSYWN